MRPLTALALLLVLLLPALSVDVRAAPTHTDVGGPIISDTTWTQAASPYAVTSNVQVMTGVTLTIEPGVVVKFNTDKLLQVDGTLVAQGSADSAITFTSNQASPQPGDWGNIEFTDSSVDATFDGDGNYTGGSILWYCTVEYGGSGDTVRGAIETNDASPLIDRCIVRNNSHTGIYGEGTDGAPIVISDCVVSGNSANGIHVNYGTVTGNSVSGNSTTFVYSGGGICADNSTVTGNVVNSNSAGEGGGIYADNSTVASNIISGNSSNWDGGGIYALVSMVTRNVVSGNSAGWSGGGISAGANSWTYASMVTGNFVSGNSAVYNGGGILANYGSTVTDNVVSSNSADQDCGGISASWYTTVMSNTVTANSVSPTGHGSGVCLADSGDFFYNTIVGNTTASPTAIIGGVSIFRISQAHYNNLYGNFPYDVVVLSSDDISGTNNYWGTVATVDILAHVYDWYDDSSRGRLLYIPYLQDPDPNAPVPPPQNLQASFTDGSADLSWDAIPSTTTGYGYKVCYDNDAPSPPYDGTGAAQGDSLIDVGNATNHTLSGLGSGTCYVAVIAYDTLGRGSWYSNEVNSLRRVFLPLVLRSH